MPEKFNRCVANGGKVRTIKPKAGRYQHVCVPRGGGPSVGGEVKKNKTRGKRRR